jgi:hypothetical protein
MEIDEANNEEPMDDDGLPGSDMVEEYKTLDETREKKSTSVEPLTNQEIDEVQVHLRSINRPTWNRGPPINLGDAEHGKLKAEQWRSMIEFDLPVILCRMWGPGNASAADSETSSHREQLAHTTMLLAMAIRWGTSHVTSEYHARQYKGYMRAYLEYLKKIFPELAWRPNHHAALHLDDFLRRYGPMHGWWMFPFERIIGCLQKTNTNHKIGQFLFVSVVLSDVLPMK